MANLYRDYFKIDENYFPCVNESAINAGLKWEDFYPHSTFIDLLRKTERVLSRQEKRSIWISGAYGTGKSYAAFALSELLTAPNAEVEAYFDKYDALKEHKTELMQRLIASKNEGKILTCYRYGSSAINTSNDLVIVLQDLISKSVEKYGLEYKGENTLKQSILEWLAIEPNRTFFSHYVDNEYSSLFGGWNTDEIIEKLSKSDTPADLVGKINKMASEIGIIALKIDMDGLITYIKDIIAGNSLKALVFVLDEFSEFFQNNRGRLTDFQKLVETCVEVPFYLLVVAHQMGSYFHEKDSDAKKIKDRFLSCEISMPDNIAFDLMKDALKIKEEAKQDWENKLDDLQDFTKKARKAVSDCTGISSNVLKGVLPLHPMSALLLKHISSAFESNQRSMFDFIKNDGQYKAFQWFIDNHGPLDGTTALLTVDMLWDFFYETGKDHLAVTIRNILDAYKKSEQQNLMSEEHQVLKTVLIMQAVSTHLNDAIPLFMANEQNLYLCFEGTDYEQQAPAIAEKLVRDEVLYKKPLGNNKFCYATTIMAGDVAEIDKKKKEIIERLRTQELCIDEMARAFSLTVPLKMRYEQPLTFVAHDDITIKTNRIVNTENDYGFHALIGLAKDENEGDLLRKLMQDKIKNTVPDNKNIVFIDTTLTPFGKDSIEQYADYMAGSEIHRGRDNAASEELLRKAKQVAGAWGSKIYNGNIIVYSKRNTGGERYNNWQEALRGLRELVEAKYPNVFEYTPALTEITLGGGSKPVWVEAGISEKVSGQTVSAEKIVANARKDDRYWESNPYDKLSIIKTALDKKIADELSENAKIAIKDILSFLIQEFGFVPSNLYSFIVGFLLKEYATDSYRWSDGANNGNMDIDKMKEYIDEAFKQFYAPSSRYTDKFIRIMSHEEQLFCKLASKVFELSENHCGSVEDAVKNIRIKAKNFRLPLWVLEEKASGIELDFIQNIVELLNPNQNTNISAISIKIGKMVESDDTLSDKLKNLITAENCRMATKSYLSIFEDGKLISLAKEIRAEDKVVDDIQRHFYGDDAEGLWLWNRETGEGQIGKVVREYEFIKKSNQLLKKESNSIDAILSAWKEKLKFYKVSNEVALENVEFAPFISTLKTLAAGGGKDSIREINEKISEYSDRILIFLKSDKELFSKACSIQLDGLSEREVTEIYQKIPVECFVLNKQEYLSKMETAISEYKANLKKLQLRKLWEEKTGTEYPYQWSTKHKTPLLACVPTEKWNDCKRVFGVINRQNPEESEVKFALEYLEHNDIWRDITDEKKIDEAFSKSVLDTFKSVLTDLSEVREYLLKTSPVQPYDWCGSPEIKRLIKELAQKQYQREPFERVGKRIDKMNDNKLRDYLKKLVKNNMAVGIAILEDKED